MKVGIFLKSSGEGVHAQLKQEALRSFHAGLRRHGVDAEFVEDWQYRPCDVAVMFGALGEKVRSSDTLTFRDSIMEQHQGHFVFLETPLLGRRVHVRWPIVRMWRKMMDSGRYNYSDEYRYFRVGIDGFLQDDADFANRQSPPDRWRALSRKLGLKLKPYRRSGRHILVVGQTPGDASLRGVDIFDWLHRTVTDLRQATDRPIVVRPHPATSKSMMQEFEQRFRQVPGCTLDFPPRSNIQRQLRNCWALVAWSSSSTIDALIEGVPCLTFSSANMAWPVSDHDIAAIEQPTLFERESWLNDLAYAQWAPEEMASGILWPRLRQAMALTDQRKGSSVRDEQPAKTDRLAFLKAALKPSPTDGHPAAA